MCGIAGGIGLESVSSTKTMLSAMSQRGPDDEGIYFDEKTAICLGHKRLAIIDLSAAGHQPMTDTEEHVWVSFNGEIYNYKALQAELREKGHVLKSNSDTEVIVQGYRAFGSEIFEKLDGMWAVALYDKKKSKLILSRDPAGIKPLYFYKSGAEFLFASEIGALQRAVRKNSMTINIGALTKYLDQGYIFGEETVFTEISSVPRATTMTIDLESRQSSESSNYSAPRCATPQSLDEAAAKFHDVFKVSVAESLQADVPVGVYLSGGIDSSLVAYYAKENGATLETFTIGFKEKGFDESATAKRIAAQFGFKSNVAMMSGDNIKHDVESILDAYGQPFADMSAIPTFYLGKLAHEHGYKVVLSGDGADELFGGYPTHYLPFILRWYQNTPRSLDTLLKYIGENLPISEKKLGAREKLERFLGGARNSEIAAHASWRRIFSGDEVQMLLRPEVFEGYKKTLVGFDNYFSTQLPIAEALMRTDFDTFLSWDCLVKSDISSMQHGVEARVPFLNKAVMNFASSLPIDMKVKTFRTKILLRKVLEAKGGHEFSRLPKQGFVPPLSRWLSEELKSAMLNILSKQNLDKVGILNSTFVEKMIRDHLDGQKDYARKIWSLMSLVRFYTTRN